MPTADRGGPGRGPGSVRIWVLAAIVWGLAYPATPAEGPKDEAAGEFKLAIAFHESGKEPVSTASLIVRDGVAYYFHSDSPREILIVEPAARLVLLDLERKVQAALPLADLDAKQVMLHDAIAGAIRKHEQKGDRANRVAAAITRSLVDPALVEAYDPATRHLRLSNPNVAVEADGEPEPDAGRRSLLESALTTLVKLESVRDPKGIPPFIRLDTLHAVITGRQLRPTELSFVYRLAGPPRKQRWTYRPIPTLTAREQEGLRRVAVLRQVLPTLSFDRYERPPAK
jgi:hypothetical protein